MKRIGKPVFFIVAAVLIAFTLITTIGIESRFGDFRDITVRGIDLLAYGNDIAPGVTAVLTPTDEEAATESDIREAEIRMRERLSEYGIIDGSVAADYERKQIKVSFSIDSVTFSNVDTILTTLCSRGEITIWDGSGKDEEGADEDQDGRPDKLIASHDEIKGASAYYDIISGNALNIQLNKDAAKRFETMTRRAISANGSQTTDAEKEKYTIFIDDRTIASIAPDSPRGTITAVTDGVVRLSPNSLAMGKQAAAEFEAKPINISFVYQNPSTISAANGANMKKALGIAILVAVVAAFAFLIIRFRVPGVAASISLVSLLGALVAMFTGVFEGFEMTSVTLPGIAGAIVAFGIALDMFILISARIKQYSQEGSSLEASVIKAFSRSRNTVLISHGLLLLISLILMGCFGPTASWTTSLLNPLVGWLGFTPEYSVYTFAFALFGGTLWNLLISYNAAKLMIRSLLKFKKLRNVKYYGGKPVEAE
jgi:Preprotein translocase subunit SecD